MNVVTFETAKRLKESGFPQPDRFGQWQAFYKLSGDERRAFITEPRMEIETFAPSATDILKELGDDYCLHSNDGKWSCSVYEIDSFQSKYDSPSEACAAAWLSIHEKSANQ